MQILCLQPLCFSVCAVTAQSALSHTSEDSQASGLLAEKPSSELTSPFCLQSLPVRMQLMRLLQLSATIIQLYFYEIAPTSP